MVLAVIAVAGLVRIVGARRARLAHPRPCCCQADPRAARRRERCGACTPPHSRCASLSPPLPSCPRASPVQRRARCVFVGLLVFSCTSLLSPAPLPAHYAELICVPAPAPASHPTRSAPRSVAGCAPVFAGGVDGVRVSGFRRRRSPTPPVRPAATSPGPAPPRAGPPASHRWGGGCTGTYDGSRPGLRCGDARRRVTVRGRGRVHGWRSDERGVSTPATKKAGASRLG